MRQVGVTVTVVMRLLFVQRSKVWVIVCVSVVLTGLGVIVLVCVLEYLVRVD